MALRIRKEDDPNEISSFYFSSFEQAEVNYFLLTNDDGSGEQIRIEFPFLVENIPSGYTVSVFTFKNQYYSQSDLIELRSKEKTTQSGRIGYAFQLISLIDGENNIFNEHTLPFAYFALLKLISREGGVKSKVAKSNPDNEYKLSDFYDEDLVLVVLCDQLTQEIPDFCFDDCLYIFFNFGFVCVDPNEHEIEFNNISFIKDNFENQLKQAQNFHNGRFSWKFSCAPKFLRDEIYPTILIKRLISKKHYFLSRFHMLYQVIEILIGDVLKNEIMQSVKNVDAISGFKLKETLTNVASEGSRIKLLLNAYSKITSGFDEIMIKKLKYFFDVIKVNLPTDDDDTSNKLPALIYKHRNNLVHNYRIIHKDIDQFNYYLTLLEEINSYFEFLIFEILHTYERPLDQSALPFIVGSSPIGASIPFPAVPVVDASEPPPPVQRPVDQRLPVRIFPAQTNVKMPESPTSPEGSLQPVNVPVPSPPVQRPPVEDNTTPSILNECYQILVEKFR